MVGVGRHGADGGGLGGGIPLTQGFLLSFGGDCKSFGVTPVELPIMEGASMTSENVAEHESGESAAAVSAKAVDDQLIDELVSRAQAEGLQLTGHRSPRQ